MEESPTGATHHQGLRGMERLNNVVSCLEKSCPWTKSIKSSDMLNFLESEVHELREEIERAKTVGTDKDESANVKEQKFDSDAILSELGDIFFDALMLEMMLRREYDLKNDDAWQIAAEKIERRTPYMIEWGDGSKANTADEATALWMAAKRIEKARIAKSVDKGNKEISKRNMFAAKPAFEWAIRFRIPRDMLRGAAFGFILGMIFTNKTKFGRPS